MGLLRDLFGGDYADDPIADEAEPVAEEPEKDEVEDDDDETIVISYTVTVYMLGSSKYDRSFRWFFLTKEDADELVETILELKSGWVVIEGADGERFILNRSNIAAVKQTIRTR